MGWVEQIADAIGWGPIGLAYPWRSVESEIGTALPRDYKELCEAFGPGEFSGYLNVFAGLEGATSIAGRSLKLRQMVSGHPIVGEYYSPYKPFDAMRGGLIQWGESQRGETFYWLADSGGPDDWRILAMPEEGGWSQFNMGVSEFIFHVLVGGDIGDGFSVAEFVSPPTFRSAPR